MDRHALAVMEAAESWDWPPTYRIRASGDRGSEFKAIMPRLLSGFVAESQALGGTLVDRFWVVVGKCHPRLEENIKILRHAEFSSPLHSETVLFEGVDRETINFSPIFQMGAELFTHLCVAFMSPGSRKSGSGTPFPVNDLIEKDTDELLQMAASEGRGTGKQAALEALPDTIKCIAMLAGTAVRDLVLEQLDDLGNLIHVESNAHAAYDDIYWGIEARNENGKIKYIYRRVPYETEEGPGIIRLRDGDQIVFGGGPEAARLGPGPNPLLCNLRLAVARVLRMSGAADIIAQMIDDGDDTDFPHVYIASPAFCDILTAQLQLAGGVLL
ncbi:uncharacterized protein EI90DRAFT_2922141 [Cantharellus anzutake]|uniref:uncharacterized protein n=1 Tax=Cantharellus anzutake TaxID=1750568 RepID=UPI001908A60F|nr:uncharacterized protein EI90DRAFT_2922141 [Cantharellus anzutake]KAF8330338.1 hypothetical protein EI90DRAFT_2922141 [Cantharellus anzutake]